MRQWFSVQLGIWHTYKQANAVVWSHWSSTIFAPLSYDLVGNANFKQKPRLKTIATFLTYVRLAYPAFKANLDSALKKMKRRGDNRVAMSHLRDLKKLVEFFIPVVSDKDN